MNELGSELRIEAVVLDAPAAAIDLKKAEKVAYENNKLHKRLCRQVGQANGDFNMIEDGDRVTMGSTDILFRRERAA